MTVRNLIELLYGYNPEASVSVEIDDNAVDFTIEKMESINDKTFVIDCKSQNESIGESEPFPVDTTNAPELETELTEITLELENGVVADVVLEEKDEVEIEPVVEEKPKAKPAKKKAGTKKTKK